MLLHQQQLSKSPPSATTQQLVPSRKLVSSTTCCSNVMHRFASRSSNLEVCVCVCVCAEECSSWRGNNFSIQVSLSVCLSFFLSKQLLVHPSKGEMLRETRMRAKNTPNNNNSKCCDRTSAKWPLDDREFTRSRLELCRFFGLSTTYVNYFHYYLSIWNLKSLRPFFNPLQTT